MFSSSVFEPRNYKTADEINTVMLGVYNNMALAIINSMLISMFVSSSAELMAFFFTGIMKWIVIFAPLVMMFVAFWVLNNQPSKISALAVLHGFAALMGLSFATIFVVFKLGSIIAAFGGAAVLFGVLSFYGYFTKRSLDSWGQFLFVGLIAVLIASVINIFIGSSTLSMVVSALSIIIFLGLTAYDTQKIREMIYTQSDTEIVKISGALTLYLDFINIFLSMLNLFGERR